MNTYGTERDATDAIVDLARIDPERVSANLYEGTVPTLEVRIVGLVATEAADAVDAILANCPGIPFLVIGDNNEVFAAFDGD